MIYCQKIFFMFVETLAVLIKQKELNPETKNIAIL